MLLKYGYFIKYKLYILILISISFMCITWSYVLTNPIIFQIYYSISSSKYEELQFLKSSGITGIDLNNIKFNGTCSTKASLAGPNQKVISFSLFGNNEGYWKGIPHILDNIKIIYSGWHARIYTDQPNHTLIRNLEAEYSDILHICDITNLPQPIISLRNYPGKMWRYFCLADKQIYVVLFRDLDSKILSRERDAVMEWLNKTTKSLHVMRDHPWHGLAMMGGTWGARITDKNRDLWKTIRDRMFNEGFMSWPYKYIMRGDLDQLLLQPIVWPNFQNDRVAHDSYTCEKFNGSLPWPTKRPENRDFVGARDFRNETAILQEECPKMCRPKNHQDWLYC